MRGGSGRSIDTSMGFTPLEGLVMGTRSGDVDASALLYLITREGVDPTALLHTLNNESGLQAVSGVSNDMRDVMKAADSGNDRARFAVDIFCYRAKKFIGAYMAAMNGADALIFTAGIGEHSAPVRAGICQGLINWASLSILSSTARNRIKRDASETRRSPFGSSLRKSSL